MTIAEGRVHQLNVSRGGAPKTPIESGRVTFEGIVGDYQNDTESHGGPMRALCLFTLEEIQRLVEEGHPIYPGATGENVTLSGIPLDLLTPGARLTIGETLIEVTGFAFPCKEIAPAFSDSDFTRISQKLFPGESRVYARVLREGEIRTGDSVRLLDPVEATPTAQ